jgi:hypothetical protein
MVFIKSLAKKLVGCEFEIECHDMEVRGIQDNSPPLYKGPGIISGKEKGAISFRLHNQIEPSEEAIMLIFKDKEKHEDAHVRVLAEDYDDVKWSGGWSIPSVEPSKSGKFLVHGQFDQLSARVRRFESSNYNNTTELIFSIKPELPLTELVEEKRFHHGEQILSRTSHDRHELHFHQSKIRFFEDSTSNFFHIIADINEEISSFFVENCIPEALVFVTASLVYPRMIVRHFENNSIIFLRNIPSYTQSKMPPPIVGSLDVKKQLWGIFEAYLGECLRCRRFEQLEQLEMTQIFSEIAIASNGTPQAFALSLAVTVENLVKQLSGSFVNSAIPDMPSNDDLDSLQSYIEAWEGNAVIKDRVVQILRSQLRNLPTRKKLEILCEDGVVKNEQIKAWNDIRNPLAHGKIIEFPMDDSFWQRRNLLISMVYRLALHKIGYKGLITDYASPDLDIVDFQWGRSI